MPTTSPDDPPLAARSDTDLLAAIVRDLRAIYAEVIRRPLPDELEATLTRLEERQAEKARTTVASAR